MGVTTSETCVFKRQVINLRNCCIWLADSVDRFIMSVHLYIDLSTDMKPLGTHYTDFHGFIVFFKYVDKIQVWLKSDKNNRQFTWRPLNIYDNFVYKCYHGCLNSNCLISSRELHGAQSRITKMCNPNIYYVQEQETWYVDRLGVYL